jgi:hypothetical protein
MGRAFLRFGGVVCCSVFLGLIGLTAVQASPVPSDLDALIRDRAAIALNLSRPISECVVRKDTAHAAFHGCIDWHSAVHGVWALVAYTRMTGDRRYEPLIESLLTPDAIAEEDAFVAAHPQFEMPYGRSWFLRLAIEYRGAFKSERLTPLADRIAASLFDRYRQQPAQPLSGAYQSDSWALINLMDYYEDRGDLRRLEAVKAIVRRDFVRDGSGACDQNAERPEFMAICTNVAWAVSKTMDRPAFTAWVARFLPPSALAAPIEQPTSSHRAWGSWAIYAATGEPAYARAYAESVNAGYANTQSWDGPYETVRHWVAQFGIFALRPAFGDGH